MGPTEVVRQIWPACFDVFDIDEQLSKRRQDAVFPVSSRLQHEQEVNVKRCDDL